MRMLHPRSNALFCVFVILASSLAASAQQVIYVDAGASGVEDGTSWVDAFADLQDALAAAGEIEDLVEIWVAAGVYKPDSGTGDQEASFCMMNGVAMYGGFAGNETQLDQRDILLNETILSGDLNDNDVDLVAGDSTCCDWDPFVRSCDDDACRALVIEYNPDCEERWTSACVRYAEWLCCDLCREALCDNSYHVVRATDVDSTGVLDGFSIIGGVPSDALFAYGGALEIRDGSPTIRHCLFAWNPDTAINIFQYSLPYSLITIEDCTFLENGLAGDDGWALGMTFYARYFLVKGCTFLRNRSGLLAARDSMVIDCDFIQNGQAAPWFLRGFGALKGGDHLTVVNCNFIDNAGGYAGAIDHGNGTLSVRDSTFLGNSGSKGAIGLAAVNTLLENCLVAGNSGEHTGAMGGYLGNLTLRNCTVTGNSSTAAGSGNISLSSATATVESCILWGNLNYAGMGQMAQMGMQNVTHRYNRLQGWTGSYGGVGNSGEDPLFVVPGHWEDPGTPDDFSDDTWIGGDYHLQPGSSAINQGDPFFAGDPTATDLDGQPRVRCDRVDIGVYEFGNGDPNCDQTIDLTDYAHWTQFFCFTGPNADSIRPTCDPFDFDADLDIDLSDFAAFQRVFAP